MKRKNSPADLFLTFLKIGAFTFGGGYAMIPLIQREVVEKKRWISEEDILDIVAIAESTPGPIAINSATFVGYRAGGFFLIILAISCVLRQFQELKPVQYAFQGIRAGVLALIIRAMVSMYRQCPRDLWAYLLMGAAFVCVALLQINAMLVIAGCAAAGLFLSLAAGRRKV